MMIIIIIVSRYLHKGHTMCRWLSYDIMMGQHNTTMIAVMTTQNDIVWWLIVKGMKYSANDDYDHGNRHYTHHNDDDGDHSSIARISLIDDIDGGDREQDFTSMIWYRIYEQFSKSYAAYSMSYLNDDYQLRKGYWLYQFLQRDIIYNAYHDSYVLRGS